MHGSTVVKPCFSQLDDDEQKRDESDYEKNDDSGDDHGQINRRKKLYKNNKYFFNRKINSNRNRKKSNEMVWKDTVGTDKALEQTDKSINYKRNLKLIILKYNGHNNSNKYDMMNKMHIYNINNNAKNNSHKDIATASYNLTRHSNRVKDNLQISIEGLNQGRKKRIKKKIVEINFEENVKAKNFSKNERFKKNLKMNSYKSSEKNKKLLRKNYLAYRSKLICFEK